MNSLSPSNPASYLISVSTRSRHKSSKQLTARRNRHTLLRSQQQIPGSSFEVAREFDHGVGTVGFNEEGEGFDGGDGDGNVEGLGDSVFVTLNYI